MGSRRNSGVSRADNVRVAHERALDAARGCDRFTIAVLVRGITYEVSSNLLDLMKGLSAFYKSASSERVQDIKKKTDEMEEIMSTFQESMQQMIEKMEALKQRRDKHARNRDGCAIPACLAFLCFAGNATAFGAISLCSPDKVAALPFIGKLLTTHSTSSVSTGFYFGAPPTSTATTVVPGAKGTAECGAGVCLAGTGVTCWETRRNNQTAAELSTRLQNMEKKYGPMNKSQDGSDMWPKLEDHCTSMKNLLQTLSKMSKMDEDMTGMWSAVKKLTDETLYVGEQVNDFLKNHGDRATQEHLANKGHEELKIKLKEVEESVRHFKVDTQAPNKHYKFFSCTG